MRSHLQPRTVDNLVVDSHLHTIIVDDQDADAATAVVERLGQALEEVALVKDGKTLLDITGLGHGNDTAILTDVKNTVLLEDRTKHVLDNDGRSRVGDEAGLLMELLGEEVNTEVAVLASLGRGGDADDLARAALEDQEIADADVVARDGDSVGRSHLAGGDGLAARDDGRTGGRTVGGDGSGSAGSWVGDVSITEVGRGRSGASGDLLLDYDVLADILVVGSLGGVVVGVVVAVTVDGVGDMISDLVGSFLNTVTERVVVAVVVVISHITLVSLGGVNRGTSSLYSNLLAVRVAAVDGVNFPTGWVGVVLSSERLLAVAGSLLVVWLGAEAVALVGVTTDDGTGTLAELTLGNVNLSSTEVWLGTLDCVEVAVVGGVLGLDVAPDDGTLGWVAVVRKEKVSLSREEKRAGKVGRCVSLGQQ